MLITHNHKTNGQNRP